MKKGTSKVACVPEGRTKELKRLTTPLVKFLRDNYHPHCSLIIDSETVRVVEDLEGIPVSYLTRE